MYLGEPEANKKKLTHPTGLGSVHDRDTVTRDAKSDPL